MIRFENICLSYDNKENIIDNLDLTINDNEFLVIVGPSGCGKTSLVKMLAGLIKPTSGSIYINEKDITNVEPYNRGIRYMQQNSKPYPHMNVFDNNGAVLYVNEDLTCSLHVLKPSFSGQKNRKKITNRSID